MTAPARIDLALLTPDDLARLRDMLRVRPGQRSPETRAAIERRDNLIREYALRFYPGVSRNQQAECTARDLARYEASGWQHARAACACPHHDPRRQLLYDILKARPMPPRKRIVDQILSRTAGGP